MTVVVKCGGAAGVDREAVAADVARLVLGGETIVVVHGGSAEADYLGAQLGVPQRHLTSVSGAASRHTDAAALDVLTMALRGRVQPALVAALGRAGVRAVGLSGLDGPFVQARRKPALKVLVDGRPTVIRDDLGARIERVEPALLEALLDAGFVPVVCPPAWDPEVGTVNVDADRLAGAIAVALGAACLVLLSNVAGLYRDPDDPMSLVTRVGADELEGCYAYARGRMRLKVLAAAEAVAGGVPDVVIASASGLQPVAAALAGGGTYVSGTALAGAAT
jgi:[amino group carrier protein]-L-2-aminoadipate 6-kinase